MRRFAQNEADGVRFELTIPLRELRFSRPVQSAALPPVQFVNLILEHALRRVYFVGRFAVDIVMARFFTRFRFAAFQVSSTLAE